MQEQMQGQLNRLHECLVRQGFFGEALHQAGAGIPQDLAHGYPKITQVDENTVTPWRIEDIRVCILRSYEF
jgi:hypothetical protein